MRKKQHTTKTPCNVHDPEFKVEVGNKSTFGK